MLNMSKSKHQSLKEASNHRPVNTPARPSVHEIEFTLERIGAEVVYIAGDFNDWRPASLRMIGSPEAGLWEKRITLAAGKHEYKFIVDGQWLHDPEAEHNVPNIYGSLNSVLVIQE